MNLSEILERAKELEKTRRDITYGMGKEDTRPNGALDCSSFMWLILGDKKRDRNTDWMRNDALTKKTKFRRVMQPVPGVIAVYGTRWEKTPAGTTKRHAGHVGVVVDVAKKLVIDNSSSQNGIRLHRQPVLLDGPSDKRENGLIFIVPVEATDAPLA
jgi:hypothetical protein